jgi:hypothetical protein
MLTSPQLTPRTRFFRQLSPDIVSRSKRLHFLLVVLRKHIKRPCSTNIFLLLSIFLYSLVLLFPSRRISQSFRPHSRVLASCRRNLAPTGYFGHNILLSNIRTSHRTSPHRKGCFVMGEQKTTRRNLRRENAELC